MLRPYNMATRAAPFDSLQVADIGDVPINTFDLKKSVNIISDTYMSFEIWFTIAAVYMVVTLIISTGATLLERRYTVRD